MVCEAAGAGPTGESLEEGRASGCWAVSNQFLHRTISFTPLERRRGTNERSSNTRLVVEVKGEQKQTRMELRAAAATDTAELKPHFVAAAAEFLAPSGEATCMQAER